MILNSENSGEPLHCQSVVSRDRGASFAAAPCGFQQASVISVLKRGRPGASARFMRFFGLSLGAEWFDERPMRCIYCRKRAGLMRRVCEPCGRVVAVVERAGGDAALPPLPDLPPADSPTRPNAHPAPHPPTTGDPTPPPPPTTH